MFHHADSGARNITHRWIRAKGVTCHWLTGNDKKVICTWNDKMRGGGSGAILYADALVAASSSASK